MDALVAGALGGMLLGMISLAHISLLLVFRPPRALLRKAGEEGIGNAAMFASTFIAFTWGIAGIGAGFLFSAIEELAPTSVPAVPSFTYLAVILVLAVMFAIPGAVILRDRLVHLGIQLLLFVGIFGFLIPNLVMAQRT